MSPSATALTIIFGIVAVGSAIGFYAGTRQKMSLEQWTVGSRGFGTLLMWLLMAGESYTTFSVLGASGWVYSRGGPALYILAYITLSNVVSFFVMPHVWELGRAHGMQTQPDFFRVRYGSTYLAALVAAIGVVFIVPYLQLQLTGLGIIVEVASFETIGRTPAMTIAVTLVAGFVFVSGVRAVAWVSIVKDVLMVIAAVSVGIGVPYIYFGGLAPMFAALASVHPQHLVMPGSTRDLGHAWYVSTVLLTSLGGYMWPHGFGASFTAKSGDTLRRNAVVMPIYTLTLAFIFFTGFAALLVVPGLENGDLALLTMVRRTFPAWMLGIVGGAGALTAMVPAAILVLTASTLFAKNLYRPLFAPGMSDDQVARLARAMVIVLSAVSLYFAMRSSATLVSLLLLGYAGITQFFPGVALGLFWRRASKAGVFAGLLAGVTCAAVLILGKKDPIGGINAGFIALCLNFAVSVVVSLLVPRHIR
jgi:SSS family solute:Na+ symporter